MMVSTDIQQAITAVNNDFMRLFNEGNTIGMSELYTGDGQVQPPFAETITGRIGIASFWNMVREMGFRYLDLQSVEILGLGNLLCESGEYRLYDAEKQELDNGKYMVIWKQESGEWKLHRDIWNTNRTQQ